MKSSQDAEDMVQDTFVKLINSGKQFESPEHEKAWLIVTASNLCKSELRRHRRREEDISEYQDLASEDGEHSETMDAIMALPAEYKAAVYMYYYEGYSTAEIAKMLSKSEGTVRSLLHRARKRLKKMLGGEFDE